MASRVGLSAIPAYLLAGLLLGPNEPKVLALIRPSEVTDFVAEIGIVFLLFFLGLEFTLGRLARSHRHVLVGGAIDLIVNGAIGLVVGVAAFGLSFGALILAAAIYVSSSAITVKGLIDFRRLADDETDLVLAILVVEDIVIALVLGFASGGGGELVNTLGIVAEAIGFIAAALAVSKWLRRPIDLLLDRLPREVFLLAVFSFVVGSAALSSELGLSEAIGLFFFVFGLSIDVSAVGRIGWLLALAVTLTVASKVGGGFLAGMAGGYTRRQSFNAGVALVAHGEFTIILAQVAAANPQIARATQDRLVAFAGLYVLATATLGLILMKESKSLGRWLLPAPKLVERT